MIEMMISLAISAILLVTILKLTTTTFNVSISNLKDNYGIYKELETVLDYETAVLKNQTPTLNIKAKSILETETAITYKSNFGYTGVVLKNE